PRNPKSAAIALWASPTPIAAAATNAIYFILTLPSPRGPRCKLDRLTKHHGTACFVTIPMTCCVAATSPFLKKISKISCLRPMTSTGRPEQAKVFQGLPLNRGAHNVCVFLGGRHFFHISRLRIPTTLRLEGQMPIGIDYHRNC